MLCSDTCFLELGGIVSLKVTTKRYFRGEKLGRFKSFSCFSKAKTEECDQKYGSFYDKFGMIMLGSGKYCREVSGHASLKVAIDDSF